MKKLFFILIAFFVVATIVSMVAMPSAKTGSTIYISGDEGKALPDNIMKIVKVSCMDCHADGGNKMACTHINFSIWSTYKEEKQEAKAKDMCKILTKGDMPPRRYRESNPDAVPTKDQINTICAWAKSLND